MLYTLIETGDDHRILSDNGEFFLSELIILRGIGQRERHMDPTLWNLYAEKLVPLLNEYKSEYGLKIDGKMSYIGMDLVLSMKDKFVTFNTYGCLAAKINDLCKLAEVIPPDWLMKPSILLSSQDCDLQKSKFKKC